MIVLKHVLVGTDFSAASEAALTYGRALAQLFGATLHLLHVAENDFLRSTPADPRAVDAGLRRALAARLTDEDRRTLHARAIVEVSDAPEEAIVEYARSAPIDLIVLGTHGRTGVSHALIGSVAERVVRTAPCPVLTVRQPEHEFVFSDAQKSEAAMILLKNILVATDFSEPSDAALAYGRELARTFSAQLVVLNVTDNIMARAYGGDGFVFSDPLLQQDVEAAARKQADALLSDEDRDQLRAKALVLTSNTPAFAIVDYARANNVDLIVMGTHGRGAVAQLLMGSVAERVVRTAPCPVLTVRHPEHEFVLPDALVAVAKA
jgi:nucleotide-binding universal stress UspA family protein